MFKAKQVYGCDPNKSCCYKKRNFITANNANATDNWRDKINNFWSLNDLPREAKNWPLLRKAGLNFFLFEKLGLRRYLLEYLEIIFKLLKIYSGTK